ncbi:MAG: TM0106 family RecB-like putative nuclease [Proteobacteria bacterium]|nr:TM0106 family RecB-like putative nuclease [Pseudomonadota bacterium]
MLWERGIDFEKEMIATLAGYVEPQWDEKDWEAGHRATTTLMEEGHQWIYQGVLTHELGAGLPDLLKRFEQTSRLGKHSYMPVDIKSHKAVTIKDRYQLATYALFLEPILGYRPHRGAIWLNTGDIEEVDLKPDEEFFLELLERMEAVAAGSLRPRGFRCSECGMCPWYEECRSRWGSDECVCKIYGVSGDTARRFHDAGFQSWRDVVSSSHEIIAKRTNTNIDAARDFWLGAKAWQQSRPVPKQPVEFPTGLPIYFYDIETFGDCTYLHGVIRVFGEDRTERQFLARSPDEEGTAWHQFLDFLAQDTEAIVYNWADYERGFAHSLWAEYGGNEVGWRHLRDSMHDQCDFVRTHFALPSWSYSIKHVAPLFGFEWDAEDAGGLNSEAWYGEWLRTGDNELLAKILRYNLDDVVAMEVIDDGLQRAFGGFDSPSHETLARGLNG